MTAPSEALLPFLAQRRRSLPFDLAFRPPFRDWREQVRGVWRGGLPPDGPAQSEGDEGLVRFLYQTGDHGAAYFLCPPGAGPHPAILLMHDHGAMFDIGWQKAARDPAGQAHVAKHYDGVFLANALCDAGFAVLVADALGFGSRYAGGYDAQQALAAQAMLMGWSLAGLVAADDLAALGWLRAHPRVDPARIGTMGFSLGGFRAWQVAALSDNVRATASIGWMGTLAGLVTDGANLLRGQSAFFTLHPQLAGRIDYPDMAALAVDRPMFVATGLRDRLFPPDTAQGGFDRLDVVADAVGAPRAQTLIYDGTHHFPLTLQARVLEFLRQRV